MKKLMIAASAALCATVGFSLESANVVGYNTVTLKKGWNMMAVNFEQIADNKSISIQDLIPGTTEGLTGNTAAANADQIQVYDPEKESYTVYSLYYTTLTLPALTAKNYKWVTAAGAIADVKFSNGSVFWFRKQGENDVTINVSGAVSAVKQDITIVNGWNMIGSAFPVNFNPNALGTEYWKNSGAVGNTAAANADQIQIYNNDSGNYTIYSLYYTTLTLPALTAKNWKWVNASGTPIEDMAEVISVGKGAWYRHQGSGFTLSINSPISK